MPRSKFAPILKTMKKLVPWFGTLGLLIVIFGTIYTVVQQSQRLAANNPQIQLAEDTASLLQGGAMPSDVIRSEIQVPSHVDLRASLAPFIVIYDKYGNPVAGTGYLNGRLPAVPVGVLTTAEGKDYHFVTWQPADSVRIAAVTTAAGKYYVLCGRNMRETEKAIARTLALTAFGLLASIAVLASAYEVYRRLPR